MLLKVISMRKGAGVVQKRSTLKRTFFQYCAVKFSAISMALNHFHYQCNSFVLFPNNDYKFPFEVSNKLSHTCLKI